MVSLTAGSATRRSSGFIREDRVDTTPRVRSIGGWQDGVVKAVDVVLANNDRVTVRVGDVFLKIDADPGRSAREVEAMTLAPVPTPEVLWRRPPVVAIARVPGAPLDEPGRPSNAAHAAWAATTASVTT